MIEQTVIHFHIPKAAGSTIDTILAPCFREEERFHCGNNFTKLNQFESNVHFSNMPDLEKAKYKYISGHVEYFLLHTFPEKHFSFTILRNPLDRMLSMYYYILRAKTHHLHNTLKDNNLSVIDFMEGAFWHEIDNGMCRRISGVCAKLPYGGCTEEVLNLAKFNLENNISFIGLQERFNESLFLLLYHLKSLDRLEYTKANVNQLRKMAREVPEEDKRAILRRNALDLELYAFARDVYAKRNKKFVEILRKPMQSFLNAMSLKEKE